MHTPQRTMELSTSLGELMWVSANMGRTMRGSSLLQTFKNESGAAMHPGRSYYLSVPDYLGCKHATLRGQTILINTMNPAIHLDAAFIHLGLHDRIL